MIYCIHGSWSCQILKENKHQLLIEGLNTPSKKKIWVVVSNIFYFHPYLNKWSNWTNIFEMGWNHQPEIIEHQKSKNDFEVLKHPQPGADVPQVFSSTSFQKPTEQKEKIQQTTWSDQEHRLEAGETRQRRQGVRVTCWDWSQSQTVPPIPSMGLVYLPRFTRNISHMYRHGLFGYRLFAI